MGHTGWRHTAGVTVTSIIGRITGNGTVYKNMKDCQTAINYASMTDLTAWMRASGRPMYVSPVLSRRPLAAVFTSDYSVLLNVTNGM